MNENQCQKAELEGKNQSDPSKTIEKKIELSMNQGRENKQLEIRSKRVELQELKEKA